MPQPIQQQKQLHNSYSWENMMHTTIITVHKVKGGWAENHYAGKPESEAT